MRFVKDQRVVLFKPVVVLNLGQQDSIGHQLDSRIGSSRVGESSLVGDSRPPIASPFLRQSRRDRPGGDPAGLRVANQAIDAASQFQTDSRHLRGLARSRFAANHDHRVCLDRGGDPVAMLNNRQCWIAADWWSLIHPRRAAGSGTLPIFDPRVPRGFNQRPAPGRSAQIAEPTTEPAPVPEQGLGETRFPLRIVKLHRFNRRC